MRVAAILSPWRSPGGSIIFRREFEISDHFQLFIMIVKTMAFGQIQGSLQKTIIKGLSSGLLSSGLLKTRWRDTQSVLVIARDLVIEHGSYEESNLIPVYLQEGSFTIPLPFRCTNYTRFSTMSPKLTSVILSTVSYITTVFSFLVFVVLF